MCNLLIGSWPKHAGYSFLLLAVSILTSCHRKTVSTEGRFQPIFAATDDTIHQYAIAILRDHRFSYTITYGDRQPALRVYYHGTWIYRSDTLLLRYHKQAPPGTASYLVKEITGGCLSNFSVIGRPRVFLRVPRRTFR